MHQHLPKLSALLLGLSDKFPPPKVIIIHSIAQETNQSWERDWVSWEDFVQEGAQHKLGRSENGEIEWSRLSFDAPLWVLFSSGTTGRPKCVLFTLFFNLDFINIGYLGPSYTEQVGCYSRPRKNLRYVATFVLTMSSSTTLPRSCLYL